MAKTEGWKHDALQRDLAVHLAANRLNMIWEDMQLGPVHSPRPDVFVIDKSYTKFRPRIYEVKASASDFRSDVTSGKWMAYLGYASAVIFAVPRGLITKEDVPKGCGLIVRGPETWRHVLKPTLQNLDHSLPVDAWLKLVMDGCRREYQAASLHAYTRRLEHSDLRRNLGTRVNKILRDEDEARRQAEHMLARARAEAERIESESALIDDELLKLYVEMMAFFGREPDEDAPNAQRVRHMLGAFRAAVEEMEGALAADAEIARLRRAIENIGDQVERVGGKPRARPYWLR